MYKAVQRMLEAILRYSIEHTFLFCLCLLFWVVMALIIFGWPFES